MVECLLAPIELKISTQKPLNIIICTHKTRIFTTLSLNTCPIDYELILVKGKGLGQARHTGIEKATSEFIVMLDDDIAITSALWHWLSKVKSGEFAMTHVGEHLSSRVFAIHKSDYYLVGGFDRNLKYIFEDCDFAIRAQKQGLTLKVVPSELYKHVDHPRNRYKNIAALNWEYSRMLVKYKREVFSNLFEFFWRPFDWRIKVQDLATKIPFTVYWILRGAK